MEKFRGTVKMEKEIHNLGWHLSINKAIIRKICGERGYIEYKKYMLRVVEDLLDDMFTNFRDEKPFRDYYY